MPWEGQSDCQIPLKRHLLTIISLKVQAELLVFYHWQTIASNPLKCGGHLERNALHLANPLVTRYQLSRILTLEKRALKGMYLYF